MHFNPAIYLCGCWCSCVCESRRIDACCRQPADETSGSVNGSAKNESETSCFNNCKCRSHSVKRKAASVSCLRTAGKVESKAGLCSLASDSERDKRNGFDREMDRGNNVYDTTPLYCQTFSNVTRDKADNGAAR